MEIDNDMAKAAVSAIECLSRKGTQQQKEHFTKVITTLAECYNEEANQHAVLLVSNEDVLITISINADPWETAGLVQMSYDTLNLKAFQKMPESYQAN